MSLRTAYTGGVDSAVDAAITAGEAWLTTNKTAIQTALTTAAGLGKTIITYSNTSAYNPVGMLLAGTIWNAFSDGCMYQRNGKYLEIRTKQLSKTKPEVVVPRIEHPIGFQCSTPFNLKTELKDINGGWIIYTSYQCQLKD